MLELDRGFAEFERRMLALIDDYPKRKQVLLRRLGSIYQAEVKTNTPVDTGRLRASITIGRPTDDEITVGTNVEYARFVEEGHNQRRRWVSGYFRRNGTFVYDPTSRTGMMLTDRFVRGAHMFQRSIYSAEHRMQSEINEFMRQLWSGVGGDEDNAS